MSWTAPSLAHHSFASLASRCVIVQDARGVLAFPGAAAPPGARELFHHICGVVDVGGIPLAWLESAGGSGGFFRGDLVAVGERDLQHITASIVARRRSGPWPGLGAQSIYAAVVRVLLAHEIGHVVQAKLGLERHGLGAERQADVTAGWIAESLGWPEEDDALVMEEAGGNGPGASHPGPASRVAAYREGRRLRRSRAA
jgi:hypothetical protein